MFDDSFNEFAHRIRPQAGRYSRALRDVGARVMKSIFILAALFAPLIAARADLVMEQQSSDTNTTYRITIKLHADQMRMDEQDGKGHAFSVIVDLNTRDSITLMPNEKMFLKRSGVESLQLMEAEIAASHGTNDMDNAPVAPVNTGKIEKVGGYDTKIYTWSGARSLTETLWVATNFPDYESIRTDLAKIDRFDASGPHKNAQPELNLLPGMVVKAKREMKGQTAIITLISAREEPVDASLFELPADYTPWKPPAVSLTNSVTTPNK